MYYNVFGLLTLLVTSSEDGELSENESELSSLDLRIREALSRPTNFTVSHSRSQANRHNQHDIIKPVAKVLVKRML